MQIDLEAVEPVFASRSDEDLKTLYRLFWLMSRHDLVDLGKRAIRLALRVHIPIEGILEHTIFDHFCGGTMLEATPRAVDALWKSAIGSILDLSVESGDTEEVRDHTAAEVARGIRFAATLAPRVPMFAVKLSGFFDVGVLEKRQQGAPLDTDEAARFSQGLARIEMVARAAAESHIPISVDAEQSWIQKVIDDIALDLMRRFNRGSGIIGTTMQFYRHDRLAYFGTLLETARREGFTLAFKAVRGAYMETERARAAALGIPSPIYSSKHETDQAYDEGIALAIMNLDVTELWVATHNEESCLKALSLMESRSIAPSNPRIGFAQLKGMSDNISYNLAAAGHRVAKYVPYGPVRDVLPYLFRRADENSAVSKEQPARELEFLKREMQRRGLL